VSGDEYNRLLNGTRVLVGIASMAAPRETFRAGIDPRRNPQLPFMTRMFGVRDLVLGVGALGTSGDERRRWLQLTVAADAVDALAAIAGHRGGYLSTRGAVMLALPAITGTALGLAALASGD
jgi:hypothetical protein